jgi:DNA-binding winged helix-turn-helix (wHTH) protein
MQEERMSGTRLHPGGVARAIVTGYAFGPFTLDLLARSLSDGSAEHLLERQPLELLAYLIEHRARVVSKRELNQALWESRAVSDGALTQCVWTVRRALGDHRGRQAYIRTITGVGYRFVGEVHELRRRTARARSEARQGEGLAREGASDDTWPLADEAAVWLDAVLRMARDGGAPGDPVALTNAAAACERFARAVLSRP